MSRPSRSATRRWSENCGTLETRNSSRPFPVLATWLYRRTPQFQVARERFRKIELALPSIVLVLKRRE
jgi:hypothetical protein